MRVIIEVAQGTAAGEQFELAPGEVARIGRDPQWSDYAYPEDQAMSPVHLVIACDEVNVTARDANTRSGILINGTRTTSALLKAGDRITAGQTTFVISIEEDQEEAAAPAAHDQAGQSALSPLIERLLLGIRQSPAPVYALVDCAQDEKVLQMIGQNAIDGQTLFEGPNLGALIPFSPHLIVIEKEAPWLEDLLTEGWGKSWMVLVVSSAPFANLREHFRYYLQVLDEDGKTVYFRFYDPRILRLFLPACTPAEAHEFFGPVQHFWIEDENPEFLLQFDVGPGGARKQQFSLVAPQGNAI